ncbi:MAG: peptidoglycan recognition family protein, partial [Lachnospiraceae bacterium]|nr:peptidoglycan recognition family protein [Lachnospiraceae bacterium]
MAYNIINAISKNRVPGWGNQKKYIAVHYLGVVGQNHDLASDGSGAHYYIYWDGTIYQRCSHDAIVWAVGTAGYYTQKHPVARNANTISIEMCCKCDGDSSSAEDKKWYFTKETQEACVWLVQKLMKELGIPVENVLRHYDIVNKVCPAPYVHNNKYKTTWTWEEFKAKLIGIDTPADINIKGIAIGDSNVEAISKVVYGEAGVIKSYDALVAVAQCIHDML